MIGELAGLLTFGKFLFGVAASGMGFQLAMDKDIHSLFFLIKKGVVGMKKVKRFEIGNEHVTVIGLTQHGKTYGTVKTLEKTDEAILFFNTNHSHVGSGWIEGTGKNTPEQMIHALKKGYKVNFLPSDDSIDKMSRQLDGIVNCLYLEGKLNCRIVIDEVHLFKMSDDKKGHKSLLRLATTGLGRGFKCVFISQRGAMVDNTIYTQSTKHIMYALGKADYKYIKELGFPSDEIERKVNGEKYNFVEFDQKTVSEVKRID